VPRIDKHLSDTLQWQVSTNNKGQVAEYKLLPETI
jgi:hypothetical protein